MTDQPLVVPEPSLGDCSLVSEALELMDPERPDAPDATDEEKGAWNALQDAHGKSWFSAPPWKEKAKPSALAVPEITAVSSFTPDTSPECPSPGSVMTPIGLKDTGFAASLDNEVMPGALYSPCPTPKSKLSKADSGVAAAPVCGIAIAPREAAPAFLGPPDARPMSAFSSSYDGDTEERKPAKEEISKPAEPETTPVCAFEVPATP
mmetsp:Transcript_26898/g.46718  ORF Transcript_26898/g.46718 Transcript_26898/m.46718 type:complete len:207 (-) Transcript_26898:31-651(-)